MTKTLILLQEVLTYTMYNGTCGTCGEFETANCFAYPRGDRAPVFEERRLVKPLEELAKRGDDWNDSVVRSCVKQLAKRP